MRPIRQEHEAREMADLRREAGLWLRGLRERRGLSQRQLAERVGIEYYTFVSQIEAGRGRIPAERYQQWADALEVEASAFVRDMLRFYEPTTFSILFGQANRATPETVGTAAPAAVPGTVIPLRP